MIKQKRYERILAIVGEQHAVSIETFCKALDVSKATVRRDLMYLDAQKLLKRTHGGAVSLVKPVTQDVPIALRSRLYRPEKERIAQAALTLVEDGMTVFVGAGTTMRVLASHLRAFSQLTVLTNDIGVAGEIAQHTTNSLIVSGGRLTPATATLTGPFAQNTLRDLRADIAFMSADAVGLDGFMDISVDEAAIKRLMLQNAHTRVMLCDRSKFAGKGFMTICPLDAVDLTITDEKLPPRQEKALAEAGLVLRTA